MRRRAVVAFCPRAHMHIAAQKPKGDKKARTHTGNCGTWRNLTKKSAGSCQIYRPAQWCFRPFLARHEGGRPSAQFFREGVCRRSLHCLASSRRAKPQNEISPLYIVGSDSVATLQSDKRIFFKTLAVNRPPLAQPGHPPRYRPHQRPHVNTCSRRADVAPQPSISHAQVPPPLLLPSSPLERMFDPRPHPISPFFRGLTTTPPHPQLTTITASVLCPKSGLYTTP